jgi:chromosome partitioning protein
MLPLPGEFLPLKGVYGFMRQFDLIRKKLNPRLELMGMVMTKYDERKQMNVGVRKQLEEKFIGKVFETVIRTNIQLAKAQEAGKDIFRYDRSSNGAKDYKQLAAELMKRSYAEPVENEQLMEAAIG